MQHHVQTVLRHKTLQRGKTKWCSCFWIVLVCLIKIMQHKPLVFRTIKVFLSKSVLFFVQSHGDNVLTKTGGEILLLIPLDTVVSMHTDTVKTRHFYYVWALGVQSAGIKQAIWLCEQCAGCYPKRGFICTQWKKFAMTWPQQTSSTLWRKQESWKLWRRLLSRSYLKYRLRLTRRAASLISVRHSLPLTKVAFERR